MTVMRLQPRASKRVSPPPPLHLPNVNMKKKKRLDRTVEADLKEHVNF